MSPRPQSMMLGAVCVLAASAHVSAQTVSYIFEGLISDIGPDLIGTAWEGIALNDPFTATLTIDPDAAVTDAPNPNNNVYGLAILDYEMTIGGVTNAGVPDPPEHTGAGLRIVNNQPNNLIAASIDTATYDINLAIILDPAALTSTDIPTTPGFTPTFAPRQGFIGLDGGLGGFITLDMASLTIVPAPASAVPGALLIAWCGRRRR